MISDPGPCPDQGNTTPNGPHPAPYAAPQRIMTTHKDPSIEFHIDRAAKHPSTNRILRFIEISETPETPGATDSSLARFLPSQASLTQDARGVTLRLADGEEHTYGWPMIADCCNVPVARGK